MFSLEYALYFQELTKFPTPSFPPSESTTVVTTETDSSTVLEEVTCLSTVEAFLRLIAVSSFVAAGTAGVAESRVAEDRGVGRAVGRL